MKKTYTLSIDSDVMEKFQELCIKGSEKVKFSHEIERLLNGYVSGEVVFTDKITASLHDTKESIGKLKEMVNSLDDILNQVVDEESVDEFNSDEVGGF